MPALMRKINMISRGAAVFRAERVEAEGLLPHQHAYVLAVVRHPGMSQEELAARLCTTKSTVARQLSRLEENGYVCRRQSEEDRRVLLVYPTERMLSVHPSVVAAARAWNEYLFAELSEEEKNAFNAILERITTRASDYVGAREEAEE